MLSKIKVFTRQMSLARLDKTETLLYFDHVDCTQVVVRDVVSGVLLMDSEVG